MNLKKTTFLILSIFIFLNAFAQENSILWKISGNDLKQDSYIVGTIHMMCPDDLYLPQKVQQAIADADQIIFEVNISKPETLQLMQKSAMTPSANFFQNFDATKVKFIDSVLVSNGLSMQMFDMMSPSTISSLLILKSLNCPNPMQVKSIEAEIHALAQNKEIEELETAEFQINLLNSIFTPDYIYQFLTEYDKAPEKMQSLTKAYKEEDLKTLGTLINDPKSSTPEQLDQMLTQRNLNWTTILPEKIKDKKSVIAVGAGHLVGDKGIIKLLQDKGYTVAPVTE